MRLQEKELGTNSTLAPIHFGIPRGQPKILGNSAPARLKGVNHDLS